MLEKTLHEELQRFKNINKYVNKLINEQEIGDTTEPAPAGDIPPAPAGDLPPVPGEDVPPAPAGDLPPSETDTTEELDVTDLVNMTKKIKKDIEANKTEHDTVINKMDDVFTKLTDLEQKLSQMDQVMSKIDQLGSKVENMKEPTPVEKLEMRSLDSYPFNQNPTDFFNEKQKEMRASGKNEYVLRKSDIDNFSKETIRDTFNPDKDEY